MPAGRPPKPTELKRLHGTDRSDRRNDAEPVPPEGTISYPNWLSQAGQAAWENLAPTLIDMGLLTTADVHSFALLCEAYALYVSASETITANGPTYESVNVKTGVTMVRQRPEVAIAADAWRRTALMMQQFGMTPSARGRVQVPKATTDDERDPFDAWERQRSVPGQ